MSYLAGANVGPGKLRENKKLSSIQNRDSDSSKIERFRLSISRRENCMARREFLTRLSQIAALPFLAAGAMKAQAQASKKPLKVMMKSAWGSDDPTKAAFPFSHGLALSEAGHEVQIYLLGEAVSVMRKAVANSVTPVGWPPIVESVTKLAAKKVPIYACGACSRARGVTEEDLANFGAKFGNPAIFVSLVEWADHVITE